jgi:chain length determinant protein EpsF
LNLQQFILILRARRLAMLALFVLVVATGFGISVVLPKQYSAVAEVLVDAKARDPVYGNLNQNAEQQSPGYLATQVDIIMSERLALQVVDTLHLDQDEARRAQWQKDGAGRGSFKQYVAAWLQKRLEVKPVRESSVLAIQFTAPDPVQAADIANGFARIYVDMVAAIKSEPARASSQWFDQRTQQLRKTLEDTQAKLAKYQEAHGIVVNDEKLDVDSMRLAELSAQLTVLEAAHAESSSREQSAQSAGTMSPDVLQNPAIEALRSQVDQSATRLRELSTQLGRNHPRYQQAQAELDELKSRLQAETRRVAGGIGSVNAVNVQREAQVRAAFEAQKRRLLEQKAERAEAGLLQRDVEAAQRAYDLVVQRLSQTSLESQNRLSDVSLLSAALPPLEHSKPKVLVNTLLAAFVGLLLGIGLALALEAVDRRVRSTDDIALTLGIPVVAALPLYVAARPTSARREWNLRLRSGRP